MQQTDCFAEMLAKTKLFKNKRIEKNSNCNHNCPNRNLSLPLLLSRPKGEIHPSGKLYAYSTTNQER